MKNLIVFLIIFGFPKSYAGNYTDKIFKKDSVFSVFGESQIGKHFFNNTNNNYFAHSAKFGIQIYCFQAGLCAEKEFNFTSAYGEKYVQRNKSFGAFFGLELPVTHKLAIGLAGTANFYKANLERPIYIETSNKLIEINYDNVYQAQLRFNYKLNNEFSLLGTKNLNFNQDNFFSLNLGLRYTVFHDFNGENMPKDSSKIKMFAGAQLEWENENYKNFTNKKYSLPDAELLKLVQTGSENSNSIIFPLLGIVGKRKNMILFGFNQRKFTQFSSRYGEISTVSNWKTEMNTISSRIAFELNLFSFSGKKFNEKFKQFYPFYRLTSTYSIKNFYFKEGWDYMNYGLNNNNYLMKADIEAETKSFEINNSLGLTLRLNKMYLSAGYHLFNRTYGEVNYQSKAITSYYWTPTSTNIQTTVETLPKIKKQGWLSRQSNPINVFFTVGIIL